MSEKKLTVIDSDAVIEGVIGNKPAFVFQMSAQCTFEAFRNKDAVLVKMTGNVGVTKSAEATLTASQPTASVPFNLWIGNGWMQVNDGTVDLELETSEGGELVQVVATANFDTMDSSTGKTFGTVGGTYIVPV